MRDRRQSDNSSTTDISYQRADYQAKGSMSKVDIKAYDRLIQLIGLMFTRR